jgi:hypothetical protein
MFCCDTSALIECWSRYYPSDVFPGIWKRFAYVVEGGDLIASDEVHEEIKKTDDASQLGSGRGVACLSRSMDQFRLPRRRYWRNSRSS